MTIAFDAASALGSVVNITGAIDWTHTPSGTPRGILVFVGQDGNSSDQVTGVTYGGVAMTELPSSPQLNAVTAEIGAVYGYFLGASIPTGAQTVSVASSGSAQKSGWAISVTAARDMEVLIDNFLDPPAVAANPSVTLSLGGRAAFCALGFNSGQGSVANVTPFTDWTDRGELLFSSNVCGCYSYDIVDGADVTAGWTQSSDDAVLLAAAIAEVNEIPSVLNAAGVGAATFVGDDIQEVSDIQSGALTVAGITTVSFVSTLHIRSSVGLVAAGAAVASFVGSNGAVTDSPFVQEIGVVPIRFVAGIANVVPVQIVGAPGIGIVGARETTDVANVVPVRASTELGTTKIFLVGEP